MTLAGRAATFALVLFVEKILLSPLVDSHKVDTAQGWDAWARLAQHFGLRFLVSFAIVVAYFTYAHGSAVLSGINVEARGIGVRGRLLALHVVLLFPIAVTLSYLFGGQRVELPFPLVAAFAVTLMAVSVAALLAGLAPWALWRRAASEMGSRWMYAAVGAVIGTAAIVWSQHLWIPTARLTFELVRLLLEPIIPNLQTEAATRIIRAPHFAVSVSRVCSGLEGIGLMAAFTCTWLICLRTQYRFPQALLLIPTGVLVAFTLNVARIAALVLIGNSGHPIVAVYGFHSQAGWIAFNCAACGVAAVSQRISWVSRRPERSERGSESNPTAAYLMPFLAILAAGMVSRAASGHFETWFALRLLVGAIMLARYLPRWSALDWRFGWRAIAVGAAAFGLWVGAAHFILAPRSMPTALTAMSGSERALWIIGRAATAIIIQPLAEEIAYRGYLLRRLVAADFEAVPFRECGRVALLVSALAFGVIHGALWLPATAVGILYGALVIRTGRMGEAVAAHATANTLLTAWVLLGYQWQLW